MDDSSVETRWCYPDSNCGANYYGLEQGLKAFLHACIAHGFLCALFFGCSMLGISNANLRHAKKIRSVHHCSIAEAAENLPANGMEELLVNPHRACVLYHFTFIYVNQLAFPLNSAIE